MNRFFFLTFLFQVFFVHFFHPCGELSLLLKLDFLLFARFLNLLLQSLPNLLLFQKVVLFLFSFEFFIKHFAVFLNFPPFVNRNLTWYFVYLLFPSVRNIFITLCFKIPTCTVIALRCMRMQLLNV